MDSAGLYTGESWPDGLVNVNSNHSPSVPRAITVGQQHDGHHTPQRQSLHDTSLRQSTSLPAQAQDGAPGSRSTGDAASRNNDTIQTHPQRLELSRGRGAIKTTRGFTGRGGRGSHRGGAGREVGHAAQLSRDETTQAGSTSDFGISNPDTQHNGMLYLTPGSGEFHRGSPHVQRGGSSHRGHRGFLPQRGHANAERLTHALGNESDTRASNEIVGQRGRGGTGGFQRGLPHRSDTSNARGGRVFRGGRGRGDLFREYDADFDRGERNSAGTRSDKRLYQAPKNNSSAQAKQTERVVKAEADDTIVSAPGLSEYEHEEAVNLLDESSQHDPSAETGNRPGMIKTGIDVKAAPNQHKKDGGGKKSRQNDNRTPRHALNRSIPDNQSAACVGSGAREHERSERDGSTTAEALDRPYFTSSTAQSPQGPSILGGHQEAGHIRVESNEASSRKRGNSTRRVNASPRSAERRSASFSPKPAQRQLFNPSKDDPVRFSHANANTTSATAGATNVQTVNPPEQSTLAPFIALHISVPGYKPSQSMYSPLHNLESSASRSGDHSLFRRISRKYQDVVKLETSVLDEDRLAQSSEVNGSTSDIAKKGLEGQDAAKGETYWVALIALHRETAEAFQDLMEACVDIRHPATIHSIPQKHDLAKRMWRSAFQLLFNRLTNALRGRDLSAAADTDATVDHADVSSHFVDFVLYAYQFYTGVLAQTNLSGFRDVWLENLGDIASYRLAATKLLLEASGTPPVAMEPKVGQSLDSLLAVNNVGQAAMSSHREREVKILPSRKQPLPRRDRKKGFAGMKPAIDNDLEEPDTPGNSIGAAAINDWEVDEQDTWRLVAEEWYFLGLANNVSLGRLHYKIAVLTENDDLRKFYHMVKSVTVSEPHVEARQELAHLLTTTSNNTARSDVNEQSPLTTFLRLHAMLYLHTDLDNFDSLLESFELRLSEAFEYMKLRADRPRRSTRGRERDSVFEQLVSDPTWVMMAVINIASMMRYGQEQEHSPIQTVSQEDMQRPHFNGLSGRAAKSEASPLDPTPAEAELADQLNGLELQEQEATQTPVANDDALTRRLQLACKMTFKLLDLAVKYSYKPEEPDSAISPYITTIMIYLSSLAPNNTAISIILPEVPWQSLPSFPDDKVLQYPRKESKDTAHLVGIALPEDWCIRGMAWSGQQLSARVCWNGDVENVYLATNGADSGTHSYFSPTSEKDVLAAQYESPSMPSHMGQHNDTASHLAGNTDSGHSKQDGIERETLSQLRLKRLAFAAVRLARTFPFLHVDGNSGAIKLDEPALQQASVLQRRAALHEPTGLMLANTPEAFRPDKGEVIKSHTNNPQARSSVGVGTPEASQSREQQRKRMAKARISAVPGYTTMVCDTTPLLESLHVLTALVTSKCWTLIVPLAVIMMLDEMLVHIKEEANAPAQAIAFLEESIKARSANVKVQTSRGNFLRDLAIRHEEIDFDNGSRAAGNTNGARNLNDVVINVALWQKDHWLDRRALLGLSTTRNNVLGSSSKREPSKLVFLTNDKNMRHKARAKALDVWDAAALQEILNQRPNG